MTTPLDAYLARLRGMGLACLVPKDSAINSGSMLLSSHEKTVCDCDVLKLLQVVETMKAALENLESSDNHEGSTKKEIIDWSRWRAAMALSEVAALVEGK